MKKKLIFDHRAEKEFLHFPRPVVLKFYALFQVLEESGKLEEPFAKKLQGKRELFEVRVKHNGSWRALYAYLQDDILIILTAFAKKQQKTPLTHLETATKRLIEHKKRI